MKKLIPVILLTLVNTLGFSILIPVLPFILRNWNMPDWSYGLVLSLYSLCQFWAAPVFGRLSDNLGRKKLIIWSQAGTLISWIFFLALWLLDNFTTLNSIWLLTILLLIRLTDGITAGNNSVTQAYMSDIVSKEEKAKIFGYLSATMGLGMILGPAIGSYTMATSYNYFTTSVFAITINAVTLLSTLYLLPETVSRTNIGVVDWLKPFKFNRLFQTLKSKPVIKDVVIVKLAISATMGAYTSVIVLFLIDQYNLSEIQVGNFLFLVGAFGIFNQLVMVKRVIGVFGEYKTLTIGLAGLLLSLILFPFIKNLIILIPVYYFCNLGYSLALPTMRAIVSNRTDTEHQGEAFGVLESINSLMFGIMPVLSTFTYGYIGAYSFILWGLFAGLGLVFKVIRDINS